MGNEQEIQVARELGAINEKLKRIEEILKNQNDLETRISIIEKMILEMKTQLGVVAVGISVAVSVAGVVLNNWERIVKVF